MNCLEAKEVSILDFLTKNGIQSEYIQGLNFWYNSPLRTENTPSFKVNTAKNIWYDHGTGQGGDIIKLVSLMYKVDSSGALKILSNNIYSIHQPKTSYDEPRVVIKDVQELSSIPLTKYIISRKISLDIAVKFCKEVNFTLNEKRYYAIGFLNNSRGFELRNKFFKSCCSPKDVTHLTYGNKRLLVFEGFIDFLSWFECALCDGEDSDYLVLNTLSFLNKSKRIIETYPKSLLFFDNDNAGKKATSDIVTSFPDQCIDMSLKYRGSKDLNDFLMNG